MEAITYSLKNGGNSSDQYYRDASAFTDEVAAEADRLTGQAIRSFQKYLAATGREAVRSKEEYEFELLTLGVLWRLYGDDAYGLYDIPGQVLIRLSELRQQGGSLKPGIDMLRGVLATIFLKPEDRSWSPDPRLENLDKLLNWMAATGDFVQEVRRLRTWRDYWSTKAPAEVADDISAAIVLALWFEIRSETALGKYTANVEKFLNREHPGRMWREDVIFCGRRRVEYHLNMVGAEIMNRAFRQDFLKTGNKAVVLPACMRYHSKPECKARSNGLSCECTGCTSQCRVNQIMKMGEKHGFKVHLVPHESSVFSGESAGDLLGKDAGIVGIACVSNLVSGGWKAKDLGMPPQCVLLDHCGCRKHWHDKGIPTDINMTQLMRVLEAGGHSLPELIDNASLASLKEKQPV